MVILRKLHPDERPQALRAVVIAIFFILFDLLHTVVHGTLGDTGNKKFSHPCGSSYRNT